MSMKNCSAKAVRARQQTSNKITLSSSRQILLWYTTQMP